MPEDDLIFNVFTPLGFSVRSTKSYWQLIVNVKHPVMDGREQLVKELLQSPDEIRLSKSDENVYLFYKLENRKRWTCAVARRLNGDGFLITAYPTDAIKEGKQIWLK